MAKKKDATQDKGVSEEEKNLNPDTQEIDDEQELTDEEKQAAEEKAKKEEADKKKAEEKAAALSERERTIEAIAERVEADRAKEAGVEDETGKTKEELEAEKKKKADEIAAKEAKEKKKTEKGDKSKSTEDKEEEDETVEIIVDGVKKKVPKSQVTDAGIRALQKESAADVRLEEATKLLKEVKETLDKKPGKDEKIDAKTEKKLKELDKKGIDKKKIAKIREAIQFGDEDEADEAFEELITLVSSVNKIPEGVMTVEEYEKKEKQKEDKRQEKIANEINEKFKLPPDKGGFSDIFEDPYLSAAHNAEVMAELSKGTPNTWELYKRAGEKIRKWRDESLGKGNVLEEAADQQAKDELAQKREKKAKAASTTITGVNAKTTTTKKAPKEETASDIIKEMREARGQPV
jgi:hypothetical protein